MRDAGATTPRTLSTHGYFSEPGYTGVGCPYDPIGMHREQFIQEALRKGIAVPFVERTHVRETADLGAGPFLSMPTCSKGASFDRKTFFRCVVVSPTISCRHPRVLTQSVRRLCLCVCVRVSVCVCVCVCVCVPVVVSARSDVPARHDEGIAVDDAMRQRMSTEHFEQLGKRFPLRLPPSLSLSLSLARARSLCWVLR